MRGWFATAFVGAVASCGGNVALLETNPEDAGTGGVSPQDAGIDATDASLALDGSDARPLPDAADDAPMLDAGDADAGVIVRSSSKITIIGVVDGTVVYSTPSGIFALWVGGGTPTNIVGPGYDAKVSGGEVFLAPAHSANPTLYLWTVAGGLVTFANAQVPSLEFPAGSDAPETAAFYGLFDGGLYPVFATTDGGLAPIVENNPVVTPGRITSVGAHMLFHAAYGGSSDAGAGMMLSWCNAGTRVWTDLLSNVVRYRSDSAGHTVAVTTDGSLYEVTGPAQVTKIDTGAELGPVHGFAEFTVYDTGVAFSSGGSLYLSKAGVRSQLATGILQLAYAWTDPSALVYVPTDAGAGAQVAVASLQTPGAPVRMPQSWVPIVGGVVSPPFEPGFTSNANTYAYYPADDGSGVPGLGLMRSDGSGTATFVPNARWPAATIYGDHVVCVGGPTGTDIVQLNPLDGSPPAVIGHAYVDTPSGPSPMAVIGNEVVYVEFDGATYALRHVSVPYQ